MAQNSGQEQPIRAAPTTAAQTASAQVMTASVSNGPIPLRERIQTLDVLRGFALFGILLVNMAYFSHPVQYVMMPHADSGTLNRAAEWLVRFLGESKFFALFSLLFGLGFTIQMTRAEARGVPFVPRYLRRTGVLLVFGLLHGLLLWVGDILFYYAILGMLLLFFRRMKFKWVWTWIVVLLLLPPLFTTLGYLSYISTGNEPAVEQAVAEQVAVQQSMFEEMAAQAYEVYANGTYGEVTQQRVRDLIFMWAITLFLAPTIFAMFLLGSIFGRKRYIENAAQHTRLFRNLLLWGGVVGITGNAIYATLILSGSRLEVDLAMLVATWAHALGAPALMLAYLSAITLGMLNATWAARLRVLAPVGRMALTNYLLQSLICTLIFYGYGLGFFGQMGAAAGLVLTIVIYLLQIPWSHWWLARFQFGPAEWLWRTLTYGQRQPFRRPQAVAAA